MRGDADTTYFRDLAESAAHGSSNHVTAHSEALWPPVVGCETHGGTCANVADVDAYIRALDPQTVLQLAKVLEAARRVGRDAFAPDLADLQIAINVLDRMQAEK